MAIVRPASRISGRSTRVASRINLIGPLQPSALLGVRLAATGRQLVANGCLERDARRDEDEAEHERGDGRDRRRR